MAGGGSSRGRGSSKRSRNDHPTENVPETRCDGCRLELNQSSYAVLDGCDHSLCFECFGAAQAARSVEFKMKCPCCSEKTTSWKIYSYSSGLTRNAQPQHQPPVSQQIKAPLEDRFVKTHPNLYYQHQTPDFRRNYSLLTLATRNPDTGGARTYSTLLRTDGNTNEESEHTLNIIFTIARSLSPCLLPPIDKQAKSQNTFSSMKSVEQLEQEDKSPLRRFLHGLAGAQSSLDDKAKTTYGQRERNMSYVASEMVRTLKGGGRSASKLKDLVSDSLTVAGVPDFLKDLLSSFGLGKSRNYINLAQDKAVDEKIKNGWDPRGRGYGAVVGVYDNIGTRKVRGYVQFTVMAILFYSVWDLIKLNIYPDPKRKDDIQQAKRDCLSWVGEDWQDIKNGYHFEIEEKDAEVLAKNVTIPMIRFVLDAYKDILPSYQQSKQVMEGQDVTFKARVSHAVSGRVSMPPPPRQQDTTPTEASTDLCQTPELTEADIGDIDNLDNEHTPNSNSMYSRNNATVDSPIKEDLNSQKTVMGIANYFCKISERCLEYTTRADRDGVAIPAKRKNGESGEVEVDMTGNPWAEEGWDASDWPRPWMDSHGPYLCGDGQPTFAMLRLKKNHDDYKEKVFEPFNGGFHTMLETHKLRGKMFGSAHLREVWGHWRGTKAQLDWVMFPGDPNQVEDELVMYYLGAIAAAIKELINLRKERNQNTEISAFDVFTHMQEAAQQSPMAQSIYNELRFAEVIFLLQLAEEKRDANMFATGLKFASLLYTASHATKYTEIAAEFIVWWRCASEADKAIFENIVMARDTSSGKSIYTDRFVEWMIRDLRGGIGKHYRQGTDAALHRKAHLIQLEKEFQSAFKKERSDPSTSEKKVGKAFCYTLVYLIENGIWKVPADVNSTSVDDASRMRRTINALSDSAPISVEMINLPRLGEERMNTFIHINNVEDEPDNKEKRISECLKEIHPTSERQQNNDTRDLERCTSTTERFVEDNYSKNELIQVYAQIKDCWPDDNVPLVGGRKNKPDYAKAICDARKMLIEDDPQWEANTRAQLRRDIACRNADQLTTIEDRMNCMKRHPFFYLLSSDHALRSVETYTEKVDVEVPVVDPTRRRQGDDLAYIQDMQF